MLPYAPWLCWAIPMLGAVATPGFAKIHGKFRDYMAVFFSLVAAAFALSMIPDMVIDKAFINLADSTEETIEKAKEDIAAMYSDLTFIIDDAISKINFMSEMNERQGALMELVLMFTVMICIFGLISSMYAIMLERKFCLSVFRLSCSYSFAW